MNSFSIFSPFHANKIMSKCEVMFFIFEQTKQQKVNKTRLPVVGLENLCTDCTFYERARVLVYIVWQCETLHAEYAIKLDEFFCRHSYQKQNSRTICFLNSSCWARRISEKSFSTGSLSCFHLMQTQRFIPLLRHLS